jgi:hypothetical protein
MTYLLRPIAIAMILLMQGPAMLVQEVAWVKMLVSYTQERGLKRGVIETFDGQHPCHLCEKAAEIRQREMPKDPADKRTPEQRLRIAWVEMIPAAGLPFMPASIGREISVPLIAYSADDSGKGADAPDLPPPEQA